MDPDVAKFDESTVDQSPFSDPVVRCDSCVKLLKLETLKRVGACPHCGNKRVRDVLTFDSDERDKMENWGFYDFLAKFEEIPDA